MRYGNYRVIKKSTRQHENWNEIYIQQERTGGTNMSTHQQIEDQLWDYIDGLSTASEKSEIEKLIDSNIEWQTKYRELLEIHSLVATTELDEPSMRFTKNVMEEIAKYQVAPATKTYINKKIIWGIGGFFLTTIVGFLVFIFSQVKITGGNSSATSQLIDKYNPGKLDYSRLFSSTYTNIFIMINLVLGLMLLDMYLTRKKKVNGERRA
jgi:hypothetical protein